MPLMAFGSESKGGQRPLKCVWSVRAGQVFQVEGPGRSSGGGPGIVFKATP